MNKTVIRPARFDPVFSAQIDAELEQRGINFSEAVRRALRLFFDERTYNDTHDTDGKRLVDTKAPYSTEATS